MATPDDALCFEDIAEADWFGNGTGFDSAAGLARALTALDGDTVFEVVDPRDVTRTGDVTESDGDDGAVAVPAWSVRTPGVELLPPRQPGRSGWSMRNSVALLSQAENLVVRLRQEAVATAFSAAARALHDAG